MAVNRVLNYYRSHKMRPQFIQIWENMPEEIAGMEELSAAFRQAHTEEMESLLEIAIASLPNRMREVYKLRYEDEKSRSEERRVGKEYRYQWRPASRQNSEAQGDTR